MEANQRRFSLIAMPTGSGKTFTGLASCIAFRKEGTRVLIIAPTKLIGHWRAEVERHGVNDGRVSFVVFSRAAEVNAFDSEDLQNVDVFIVSPTVLRTKGWKALNVTEFSMTIVDEGPDICNSKTFKSVFQDMITPIGDILY